MNVSVIITGQSTPCVSCPHLYNNSCYIDLKYFFYYYVHIPYQATLYRDSAPMVFIVIITIAILSVFFIKHNSTCMCAAPEAFSG